MASSSATSSNTQIGYDVQFSSIVLEKHPTIVKYFCVGSNLDPGRGGNSCVMSADIVLQLLSVNTSKVSDCLLDGILIAPTSGSIKYFFSSSKDCLSLSVGLNFVFGCANFLKGTISSLNLGATARKYEKKAALLTASFLVFGNVMLMIFSLFSSVSDSADLDIWNPNILTSGFNMSHFDGFNNTLYLEQIAKAFGRSSSR